jgi:hypothetical protein
MFTQMGRTDLPKPVHAKSRDQVLHLPSASGGPLDFTLCNIENLPDPNPKKPQTPVRYSKAAHPKHDIQEQKRLSAAAIQHGNADGFDLLLNSSNKYGDPIYPTARSHRAAYYKSVVPHKIGAHVDTYAPQTRQIHGIMTNAYRWQRWRVPRIHTSWCHTRLYGHHSPTPGSSNRTDTKPP